LAKSDWKYVIFASNAVFHFINGKGTCLDSRFMWARVKAETERDFMSLVNAVCWRPAFIDGEALIRSFPRSVILIMGREVYLSGDSSMMAFISD
jgi:hypothetical protein